MCVDRLVDAAPDVPDSAGCQADAACAPGVCHERTGTCVPEAEVVFADPAGTDDSDCTRDAPCADLAHALSHVTAERRTIRVGDGAYGITSRLQVGSHVLLSGEDGDPAGATLVAQGAGILEIAAGAQLVVEGLTTGAAGKEVVISHGDLTLFRVHIDAGSRGVDVRRGTTRILESMIETCRIGVLVRSATAEIARSWIRGNTDGGIDLADAASTITNTLVTGNGSSQSAIGGVRFGSTRALSVFRFNTVANNVATTFNPGGINCQNAVTIDSTIVANNGSTQLGFNCVARYTLYTGGVVGGDTNIMGFPEFVDPGKDFHLKPQSPARDAASPDAVDPLDFDGDPRPLGERRDIGADEIL